MTGLVTSNKMTKALVVSTFMTKVHPKYHKRFKVRKKYAVACSDSTKFKIGQEVEIKECPPVSKTIRFRVVEEA
jgi:small subunit ribosomal protein S17